MLLSRSIVGAFAVVGVSIAAVLGSTAQAASAAAVTGTNTPVNFGSGTCMTSDGGGINQRVNLYGCNVNSANQVWSITQLSDGGYQFENAADGLCMSDLGKLGNNVYQYMETCNGSINQSYLWAGYGGHIVPDNDSTDYVLSSLGNSGPNAPVAEYANDGGASQEWGDRLSG